MISFELGVEDLAQTRFAVSPLGETVLSLRVLRDPGLSALHLPWRRTVRARVAEAGLDTGLLMSVVAGRLTLPDFLTPRPTAFESPFEDELDVVRRTPPERVRRDLLAAHAPDPLPAPLRAAAHPGAPAGVVAGAGAGARDGAVAALRDSLCAVLHRYWEIAVRPYWPQIRLVAEADMTYRARQLARGGAGLLFADIHPSLRWQEGVLHIHKMLSTHRVRASGQGLLLVPSVFAHKPAPPVDPEEPPSLLYPCRGVATLWAPLPGPGGDAPAGAARALVPLLGAPRARLLGLLAEPLATIELARRLRVTPSAVSQHLRVLHAAGLLTRARQGRQVLYRRSPLGDQLARGGAPPTGAGAPTVPLSS
ncbi:ArsR family transcriptional regulator [Streptomyces sp. WAC06614]|uniref:ArsR/SmtB family transcription factor n=1 Tax=Streptomyces sp. WAC06614 TaxID=2487416 RepID=UPI000F786E1E|nr:ArsR family transcriptional regulator [Streptomyces sp. WAC06614]RSS84069.1 ArsR family transcriptional regulator [Streptomyces sp. WAC06614]